MNKVIIDVELTDQEAFDLAQFCKRIGFREFLINAESEKNAYQMQSAHNKLYHALQRNGYDPR